MSTPAGPATGAPDLRGLPSVARVLRWPAVAALADRLAPEHLTGLARAAVAAERQRVVAVGGAADQGAIEAHLLAAAEGLLTPSLQPVVNATGVILQTNLGRAPLSEATIAAMAAAGANYTPLEYDLADGHRGDRMAGVRRLLCHLTGAEDALVVNNNAAATLLMLTALAAGRETIVSRGEAVEIGGGFRVPDVMAQSGTRLVEVGTTNRTYLADYAAAITPTTAALLKIHASNFQVIGFVHAAGIAEVSDLAARHGLMALDDLGSGALLDTAPYGLAHEPTLGESVAAGATVVCASGDKLLGGPQAGILVGRRAAIERVRRHPLDRAVRADKTCLAGLEATLRHYLAGEATSAIPVWRMIALPLAAIEERARAWQAALHGLGLPAAGLRPARSAVGGGALPGATLPTLVVALPLAGAPGGEAATLARLRRGRPPLVARAEAGLLLVDPRTVLPDQVALVPALLAAGLTGR